MNRAQIAGQGMSRLLAPVLFVALLAAACDGDKAPAAEPTPFSAGTQTADETSSPIAAVTETREPGPGTPESPSGTPATPLTPSSDTRTATATATSGETETPEAPPTATESPTPTATVAPTLTPTATAGTPPEGEPLPTGYPDDEVPIMPGGVVTGSFGATVEGQDNFAVAFVLEGSDVEAVLDYYNGELVARGWRIDSSVSTTPQDGGILASKGEGPSASSLILGIGPAVDSPAALQVDLFLTVPSS